MKYTLAILWILCLSYNSQTQDIFIKKDNLIWSDQFFLKNAKGIRLTKELSNRTIAVVTEDKEGHSYLHLLSEGDDIEEKNINESLYPIRAAEKDDNKAQGQINDMVEVEGKFLYLVGATWDGKEKRNQGWLVKMTIDGQFLWEKTFGQSRDDDFIGINVVDDVLFIIGNCNFHEWKNTDIWWMQTNLEGEVITENQFNLNAEEYTEKVIFAPDGTSFIGGNFVHSAEEKSFLVTLDQSGQIIPNENGDSSYIFENKAFVQDIALTYDNGVVLAGYIFKGKINKDGWMAKVSMDTKNIVWEETYGEKEGDDVFADIQQTPYGSLLTMGYTTSYHLGTNRPHIWELLINHTDGKIEGKPHINEEWESSHQVNTMTFTENGNILIGGILDEKPFTAKYKGLEGQIQNPTLQWTDLKANGNEEMIRKKGLNYFENVVDISSAVLVNLEDFYLVLNQDTVSIAEQFRTFELSQPTYKDKLYQYSLQLDMLVESENNDVVLGLKNRLYEATAPPLNIKLINPNVPFFSMAWANPQDNSDKKTTEDNSLQVKLIIQSVELLASDNFTLLVNNQPSSHKESEYLIVSKGQQNDVSKDIFNYTYYNSIPLETGTNTIQLQVETNGKTYLSDLISYEHQFSSASDNNVSDNAEQPTLWVLAIGVEHDDLDYTVKDAKDFANSYRSIKGAKQNVYKSIEVDKLIGKNATRAQIVKKLEEYKNAYQTGDISKEDVFLIFISSQGAILENSFQGYKYGFDGKVAETVKTREYRIAAHEYDAAFEKFNSIAFDEILRYLSPIECQKVLFLDACFSNGTNQNNNVLKNELENHSIDLISDLSKRDPNLVTITSNNSLEISYESSKWENGAFTEAILLASTINQEGRMNADGLLENASADGQLTLSEYYEYMQRAIPSLVKFDLEQGFDQYPTISKSSLSTVPIYFKK